MPNFFDALESFEPKTDKLNFGPALIGVGASLWALDVFFRPDVAKKMPAAEIVFFEHVFLVLLTLPFIVRYVILDRTWLKFGFRSTLAVLFIGTLSSAMGAIFLTEGYALGHIAVVAVLQQTQPLFAFVGAKFILGEQHRWAVFAPIFLLSLSGVFCIFQPFLDTPVFGTDSDGALAGIYAIAAAISWGCGTVLGRYLLTRASPAIRPFEMTTYRFLVAFLFLTVYSHIVTADGVCDAAKNECYVSLTGDVVGPIIAIATLTGAIPLSLYYVGLRSTKASISTLMELAYPVWLLVILPAVQDDPLKTIQIVGAVIVVLSSFLLNVYTSRAEDLGDDAPAVLADDEAYAGGDEMKDMEDPAALKDKAALKDSEAVELQA